MRATAWFAMFSEDGRPQSESQSVDVDSVEQNPQSTMSLSDKHLCHLKSLSLKCCWFPKYCLPILSDTSSHTVQDILTGPCSLG